jgi:hypothetical protein
MKNKNFTVNLDKSNGNFWCARFKLNGYSREWHFGIKKQYAEEFSMSREKDFITTQFRRGLPNIVEDLFVETENGIEYDLSALRANLDQIDRVIEVETSFGEKIEIVADFNVTLYVKNKDVEGFNEWDMINPDMCIGYKVYPEEAIN